jgi:hypothetical protein
MNIEMVEMSRGAARVAFLEYREAVQSCRGTKQDEILMRGYRAIAQGKALIDVNLVIPRAGFWTNTLPRLAIMRADRPMCFVRRETWSITYDSTGNFWRNRYARDTRFLLRSGVPYQGTGTHVRRDGHARVPTIPPRLRPKVGLANFHILWETDWRQPPPDPLLLKHVAGTFYAVVAQWDLTPLEAAVMRGELDG